MISRLARTCLCAGGKDEKPKGAEYPADTGLGVSVQLMLKSPRLQESQAIQQSHRWQQQAPGSEDDCPGSVAAIWVVTIIAIDRTIGRERGFEIFGSFPGHSIQHEDLYDVRLPVGRFSGCLGEP